MVMPLSLSQLLDKILIAVDLSGWQSLVFQTKKPFRLRLFRGDEKGFDVCIYIWNCTHGGGSARAANEYRVQLTGVVPSRSADKTTLLLGWHDGYNVFVAFDISKHDGQDSSSPSIQIKEETLQAAHKNAFALYKRQTGEIAVAFRSEFLVEYALNAASLHKTGKAVADLSLLNNLDALTDEQIISIQNRDRQIVISQIARKYRASDFRNRVLGAYGHRCAMCGIQLQLIDAAHIVPVASITSTDETINGVALCKLHHIAFDRNLVSFDERYKIEVSSEEERRLSTGNLSGGIKEFKKALKTALMLPNDRRDYPNPTYIKEARSVRKWVA